MKYALLFAGIGCMPGVLPAQPKTTGGYQCDAIFNASIVYNHNSGVPVAAPYILYKDSSYTAVFQFEGTGRSWVTGGGSLVVSVDTVHSAPVTFTGFGFFNAAIPIEGFDTGHHTVRL